MISTKDNPGRPVGLFPHHLTLRMGSGEFIKVYESEPGGPNRRGRPLGKWKDRVEEYLSERGVRGNRLEWARRECTDRERWRSVCRGHPLGGRFRRERGVGAID